VLWFTGLGFGARLAAPLLTTPRAWQVLDLLIAATMLLIAVKLATG
jgi:L-lysine exporter family protein LysE/ArgO